MIDIRDASLLPRTVLLVTAVLSTPSNVSAQDSVLANLDSPAVPRLVWALQVVNPGAGAEPDTVFTAAFLERIPRATIIEAIQDVIDRTGGLTLVSAWESDDLELRATARAVDGGAWWRIVLNVEDGFPHRITRLAYNEAPELGAPTLADWESLDSMLVALGETVSFAAYSVEGDRLRPLHLYRADEPVAIGSTFKLWVLGALAEAVSAGDATWTEPLAIRDEWKSLPSGRMQNLAAGETRTLAQYATQMISISDNTATDHLIHRIGRQRVLAYAERHGSPPGMNSPFLTTQEFFKLKINAQEELKERFVHSNAEARQQILDNEIANLPLPNAADEPTVPTAIDAIEWFAPATELAQLMVTLAATAEGPGQEPVWTALTRNAGFNWNRDTWPEVAYKGGREAGVVNLTWLMERHDGRRFVISFGVNDRHASPDRVQIIVAAAAAGNLLEME
jgi:beta-lactamase class A